MIVICVIHSYPAVAALTVSGIVADEAVLQRDTPVSIWGTGSPGEKVEVAIATGRSSAVVASNGQWRVTLPPLAAGGPFEMTVSSSTVIRVKNVMVGEVWICGGQSNMSWRVGDSADSQRALESPNPESMRLFRVPLAGSTPIGSSAKARWQKATPEAATRFSAVCYAFGKTLQKRLGIPVGLVDVSYPGTRIEAWLPQAAFAARSEIACVPENWRRQQQGSTVQTPREPGANLRPIQKPHSPGSLFSDMVEPMIPLAFHGVVWYQGEGNTDNPMMYEPLLTALLQEWRAAWQQSDMAFVVVQLPGFGAPTNSVGNGGWAAVREAQSRAVQRDPHAVLVPTLDLGSEALHPPNKYALGERAALTALTSFLGQGGSVSPAFVDAQFEQRNVSVRFDRTVRALVPGVVLEGFALAGADRKWYPAKGVSMGSNVQVSSDLVPAPVAVRYGWANRPWANLASIDGYPVAPFRSDGWPLAQTRNQMRCN